MRVAKIRDSRLARLAPRPTLQAAAHCSERQRLCAARAACRPMAGSDLERRRVRSGGRAGSARRCSREPLRRCARARLRAGSARAFYETTRDKPRPGPDGHLQQVPRRRRHIPHAHLGSLARGWCAAGVCYVAADGVCAFACQAHWHWLQARSGWAGAQGAQKSCCPGGGARPAKKSGAHFCHFMSGTT